MSTMQPFNPRPPAGRRGAQALGALASSAITIGALMALFHHAAPSHWRTDQAVLQAAAEVCDVAYAQSGRLRCMDELLSRHASGDARLALASDK